MAPINSNYDVERARELLARAIDRSGLTLAEFARLELIRDPKTVQNYLDGTNLIPAVVRDRIELLARRRRKSRPRRLRSSNVAALLERVRVS